MNNQPQRVNLELVLCIISASNPELPHKLHIVFSNTAFNYFKGYLFASTVDFTRFKLLFDKTLTNTLININIKQPSDISKRIFRLLLVNSIVAYNIHQIASSPYTDIYEMLKSVGMDVSAVILHEDFLNSMISVPKCTLCKILAFLLEIPGRDHF